MWDCIHAECLDSLHDRRSCFIYIPTTPRYFSAFDAALAEKHALMIMTSPHNHTLIIPLGCWLGGGSFDLN